MPSLECEIANIRRNAAALALESWVDPRPGGARSLGAAAVTVKLPDDRRIPDYYRLEMSSLACIFAVTVDNHIIVYRRSASSTDARRARPAPLQSG